jgi:hypothetical protein
MGSIRRRQRRRKGKREHSVTTSLLSAFRETTSDNERCRDPHVCAAQSAKLMINDPTA